MNRLKLTLLATAAMGAASIGGASAMPFSNLAGAVESDVQNVRVVCNRNGRCYNTARVNRARPYYAQRYYRGNRGYYAAPYAPGYGYGAYGYGGPRVGVGVGPFGFGVW